MITKIADIIKQSKYVSGKETEEEIMSIAKAAMEASERTDLEMLHTLVDAYISMCGISISCRTIIFDCGQQIFEHLCRGNEEISLAQNLSWHHIMPYINGNYVNEIHDRYDITRVEFSDYADTLLDIAYLEIGDHEVFVAMACGFILLCQQQDDIIPIIDRNSHNALEHSYAVEQIFKEWIDKQRKQDKSEVKQPTWQDISIIADTPLTREFAEYIFSKGFAKYNRDLLVSCNFDHDDKTSQSFLKAIVSKGLDWKVYDSFSLTSLKRKNMKGYVYAQARLFPTDSTPVIRYSKSGIQTDKYYQLIIQLDSVSPKVLSRDEHISDETVEENVEWVKTHYSELYAHWMNEIGSMDLFKRLIL